jgi:hypothetical protein
MRANDSERLTPGRPRPPEWMRWPARRLAWLALGSFFLLLVACRAKTVEELRADRERTTGKIVGTITDESGAPLEKMSVQVQNFPMAFTREDGNFAIHGVRAGKVVVRAVRRDRIPTSAGVTVVPGQVARVTLRSTKAPLPCCRLAGSWNLTLVMERSTYLGSLPRQALGTIRFGDPTLISMSTWGVKDIHELRENLRNAYPKDDPTVDEFGLYIVDLRPFGPRFIRGISPGERVESPETRLSASGYVHEGDQVVIEMGSEAMVTDTDGLTLEGRIEGNVIRGRWEHEVLGFGGDKRGADEGSFVMTRVAPP